jgi:hypothetical protein
VEDDPVCLGHIKRVRVGLVVHQWVESAGEVVGQWVASAGVARINGLARVANNLNNMQ